MCRAYCMGSIQHPVMESLHACSALCMLFAHAHKPVLDIGLYRIEACREAKKCAYATALSGVAMTLVFHENDPESQGGVFEPP